MSHARTYDTNIIFKKKRPSRNANFRYHNIENNTCHIY